MEMTSGVKQGAAESPMLFAFIMEVALREAGLEFGWAKLRRILPELASSDLLFMDDGVLWARNCTDLTKKISDFALLSCSGTGLHLTLESANCIVPRHVLHRICFALGSLYSKGWKGWR